MRIGRFTVIAGLAVTAALTFGNQIGQAQVVVPTQPTDNGAPIYLDERDVLIPLQPGTVGAAFEDVYFSNDRDFYTNRSIPRQFNYIFGPGILIRNGFPENEIARDGRAINELYREVLARQLSTSPLLRTRDLPNPFTESVRNLPLAEVPIQIQPRPALPPIIEEVPSTQPSVSPPSRGPVPALW